MRKIDTDGTHAACVHERESVRKEFNLGLARLMVCDCCANVPTRARVKNRGLKNQSQNCNIVERS